MSDRAFYLSLVTLAIITVLGSVLDVMEVDAAQYASMSRSMLTSDNWLLLHHRGEDYLDKPPLLFWLSALSFKLFGVYNWSYKLPSILFAFLGIMATYRFSLLHHSRSVARSAALMFGSSVAFLLMTNDVRTDTMLTGSVITAIWMGMAWIDQRRWWQLLGCAFAVAAGMMAKGPMGLMAPLIAIGGHVLFTRRWDVLRDPRLIVLACLVALLLIPMCIGLYEQHGTHGLRFYFWEQSFGRITGENRWKDDSTAFFFTHEVLWLMLPWTLFVLAGLWHSALALFRRVREGQQVLPEYASILGGLVVFIALSLSHFKLPHYLYVVVPLFSVVGARAWHSSPPLLLVRAQTGAMMLLWLAALILVGWSFPEGGTPFLGLLLAMVVVCLLTIRRVGLRAGLFQVSFWTMAAIAVCINGQFYPHVLSYQANAQVGKWVAREGLSALRFYGLQRSGTALDFYAGFTVPWLSDPSEAARVIAPGVAIWTDEAQLRSLRDAGLDPVEVIALPDHPVQLLGMEMLHPERRRTTLGEGLLLRY